MFYADTVGLKTVLSRLKEFQSRFGDDFKPAALLEKLGRKAARLQGVMKVRAALSGASRHLLPGEKGAPRTRDSPMREAVIVSTARTPIGKAYRGAFNDTQAQTLGGHVILSALKRAWSRAAKSTTSSWARRFSRVARVQHRQAVALARGLPPASPACRSTGNAPPV